MLELRRAAERGEIAPVHTALRLVGSGELDLNSFVHLVSFLSGLREACRLTLADGASGVLARSVRRLNISVVETPIDRAELGPDWYRFSKGSKPTGMQLLVLGGNLAVVDRVTRAEFDGDHQASGDALGYPRCCVRAYPDVARHNSNWPLYYLDRSREVSVWCNRLTCLRGASCPTGYLFPCSLTCEAAVAQGKRNLTALEDFGMDALSREVLAQARRCVCLDGDAVITCDSAGAGPSSRAPIRLLS